MFKDFCPQNACIDDRLARPVGTCRIHRMRRIAHQCHGPVCPVRYRIAVDHGVFIGGIGAADQGWHIQPVILPAFKMMNEIVNVYLVVPPGAVAGGDIIYGYFGDPVDHRQSGVRIGGRDRIDDHALAMRPKPDERRSCAQGLCKRCSAPHQCTSPMDRRLAPVHLHANG